ncbi:Phospholipase D, Pi-PXPH-PLD [Plasmopara halstedii]|uniref:Phospholipase n=1 Tax=Plasmopara halstedii TaxID=4781 RepID=A0A0P1AFL4_PLAHL|nr:Phospholipase D, Pi-PXPH-PLD [Plasmopara halstedii]CEG39220.1 Phospholipase D, Pi-PXPH-PLD [Plasmopara halstedii]|eukprot:XP_024575589.1 Phospholipase D, Pi-PXPH-PLD [Plasmopara halstedii]
MGTTVPASSSVANVFTSGQEQQQNSQHPQFAHTGSSVFDGAGPGSITGGPPQVDSADHFGFLHHNTDEDIYVFDEPPEVRVLGGRFEDSWPTRYVEYDVELKYKTFKWKVEIPKSSISSLWFYIKSRPHLRHTPSAPGEEHVAHGLGESGVPEHTHAPTESRWPQLRKLFLTSADKSVGSEMVALVQQLLETVVKVPRLLRSPYVAAMFQVSNSTFDDEMGRTSVREGWLKIRFWLKGNRENVRINRASASWDNECFNCMCVVKRVNFRAKRLRWVSLKSSSVAIFDSIEDTIARKAFLFDSKFDIERGLATTGSSTTLLVSNSTYVLQIEAKSKHTLKKWANDIRRVAEASTWSQSHRDGSFAIPRNPLHTISLAQWYVDGKGAYEAIYHAIQSAKKEIFIAGWWVCPTIHLLRPAEHYPESRLDLTLQKKAEEGVQVYVLMYKEISMALTLNSMFSKQVLSKLHKNVHVLRDPDFLMKQLGLWSHHEKIVSVDQRVSFVGGLDLCFGRWDTHRHELFDEPENPTNFKGKDFSNPRVKDFVEVDRPDEDMIDRDEVPRMPWHDCHCRLEGQPARDVARHFVQRWNYSVSTRRKSRKLHHLVPMRDFPSTSIKKKRDPRNLRKRFQKAVHAVRAMRGLSRGRANTDNRGFNSDRRMARMLSSQQESGTVPILQDDNDQVLLDLSDGDEGQHDDSQQHKEEVDARGYRVTTQILRSLSLWSGGVTTERSIQNAYIRLIGSAQHFVYIENQFFISGLEGDHGVSNRIANALVERIRRASDNNEKFRVIVLMPLLPAFPGKPDDKDASSLRGVMHWQYRSICRGERSIYQRLYEEFEDDDPFKYIAFYGLRNHSVRENAQAQTEEIYIHSKVMIVDDRACIIGSANINDRSLCGDRDSEIAVLVEDHEMDEEICIANGAYNVGKFAHSFRMKLFEEHFGVQPGTPMYNKYQDPVNNEAWFSMQEQAMANHQIYDSVFGCLPSDSVTSFAQIDSHIQSAEGLDTSGRDAEEAVAAAMGTDKTDVASNSEDPGCISSVSDRVMSPLSSSRGAGMRGRKSVFSGALNVNMKERSHIAKKKHELSNVQGHIVYFPLKFLVDEQLEPKLFPAELFQ